MSAQHYPTRTDANRANAQLSTGPRTPEGKQSVSTNAVRHGFTSNLQRLHPHDSPAYLQHLTDLTLGLAPANPLEQMLIRDLAMLRARLDRIEAAEYTALMTMMDAMPATDEPTAYLTAAPQLATLEKTERFLRRNYMQTWSRLERMQRERKKLEREATENQPALAEMPKQTQSGPTHSKQYPTTTPAPHPTASLAAASSDGTADIHPKAAVPVAQRLPAA